MVFSRLFHSIFGDFDYKFCGFLRVLLYKSIFNITKTGWITFSSARCRERVQPSPTPPVDAGAVGTNKKVEHCSFNMIHLQQINRDIVGTCIHHIAPVLFFVIIVILVLFLLLSVLC